MRRGSGTNRGVVWTAHRKFVLTQVALGRTNPQIATATGTTIDCIRYDVSVMMQSLRTTTRSGLIGEAFRRGILIWHDDKIGYRRD